MSNAAAVKQELEPGLKEKKARAAAWFRRLRDDLCAEFERIEDALAAGPHAKEKPGRFERNSWRREQGGGGEMAIMKGRVFEKVGVNISTVHGEFSEQFRHEIPGAKEDPRFWAAGISLVAHMQSPLVPAAHFNTRMIVVGGGEENVHSHPGGEPQAKAQRGEAVAGAERPLHEVPYRLWFGGGGDLNPMFANNDDTAFFHNAFKDACDKTDTHFYPAFKGWCDEYFFIAHRGTARGEGGIFYDYLGINHLGTMKEKVAAGQFGKGGIGKELTQKGLELAANAPLDWQEAFDFTQEVGRAFLAAYPAIIRKHFASAWTPEQREHQLIKRGHYAEYNLLYDRGTRFGLMTGGNPEAILMSLPPVAKWS